MNRIMVLDAVLQTVKARLERFKQAIEAQHKVIDGTSSPTQSHSDTSRFQESEVVQEMTRSFEELHQVWSKLDLFRSHVKHGQSQFVEVGTVVSVNFGESDDLYIILPSGGGTEVIVDGKTVTVIAKNSPLALTLMGKAKGTELNSQAKTFYRPKIMEIW